MRLRCALLAAAFLAAAVPAARSADAPPLPDGNWVLTTVGPAGEQAVCLLKAETADGKTTLTVLATPPLTEATVGDVKASDKGLSFKLKTVQTFKNNKSENQQFISERVFVAAPGTDPRDIPGSLGTDQFPARARLVATDKEKLGALFTRGPAADPWQQVQKLGSEPNRLRNKARQEKDADKKKELRIQIDEAQKEADEKLPGLFREVVETFPDAPAALDAARALVSSAAKAKVTPAEAAKLAALVEKHAARYGPRFARPVAINLAETLVRQKGLEAVALGPIEPIATGLTDKDPLAFQYDTLATYKAALDGAGKADGAKAVEARLAKLDVALDKEYLETVPPFQPKAFPGRKDAAANRVAVMELFTGAQCPPCVAADVAFDALSASYQPADVVLVQYHLHIPGPDPLTNADTVARWDYYTDLFPYDPGAGTGVAGTPTTLFNGAPRAGGGGGMANAESKFGEYRRVINPLLEKTTPIKLTSKATRTGDTVEIAVTVDGVEAAADLRLRVLLVEDTIKYVGGNRLRFHHHVVRAMPGGAAGVAVKAGATTHTVSADLAAVRAGLTKYLDEYAKTERPFPNTVRPLDLKGLKVVALVQNDKTGEIVQAAQVAVGGE